ncbi:MAG: hypothetical protein QOK49_1865 [Baekduia sp.]|nr:hypothetical protein [Baekduia sp.]
MQGSGGVAGAVTCGAGGVWPMAAGLLIVAAGFLTAAFGLTGVHTFTLVLRVCPLTLTFLTTHLHVFLTGAFFFLATVFPATFLAAWCAVFSTSAGVVGTRDTAL